MIRKVDTMWKFVCAIVAFCCLLTSCQMQVNNEIMDDTDQSTETISEIEAVTEVVVYDDSNLKISLKDINYSTEGAQIDLLFENNSDDNLTFSCSTFVVNSIMIDSFVYADVAARAKSNYSIYLDGYALAVAGIEQISTVKSYGAYIHYASPSMDDLPVYLDMSLSSDSSQTIDESGTVLYAENGITIFSKFISSESRDRIPILIKNESDKDLSVWTSYVTVNGYSVQEWHYGYVICSNSYRFLEIEIVEDSLEKNKIDVIENASFTIDFLDHHSTKSLFSTGQLYIE